MQTSNLKYNMMINKYKKILFIIIIIINCINKMQTQVNYEANNEDQEEIVAETNVTKPMTGSVDSLKTLRDNIESLSEFHQIEVLRILHSNHITFSENKNGVFVNLSYVNYDVMNKINEYVTFVNKQEMHLYEFEEKKTLLSNQYFK